MKKQAFLLRQLLLTMVLAALVAGGVFAQTDALPKLEFDNGGMSGLTITFAELRSSMRSLTVTYSVDTTEALGWVTFTIYVYYKDPNGYAGNDYLSSYRVDTNREWILRKKTTGTWTWNSLPRNVFFDYDHIKIVAEKGGNWF